MAEEVVQALGVGAGQLARELDELGERMRTQSRTTSSSQAA